MIIESKMKTRILPLLIFLLTFFIFPRPALAVGATFSLTPATKSVTVGQIFPVSISLNSGNNNISGASAIILYEPAKMKVVAADGTAVSQISTSSGTFTNPTVTTNLVDNTNGQIRLDESSSLLFTGQGTYGTFYLKALAAGSTTLAFSFSQGSTTGSVVSAGTPPTNVLSSVSGAAYTITASSESATPAPLPASGVETPTLILLFGSLTIVALGFVLARPSRSLV